MRGLGAARGRRQDCGLAASALALPGDARLTPAAPQATPGSVGSSPRRRLVHTHTPTSWGLAVAFQGHLCNCGTVRSPSRGFRPPRTCHEGVDPAVPPARSAGAGVGGLRPGASGVGRRPRCSFLRAGARYLPRERPARAAAAPSRPVLSAAALPKRSRRRRTDAQTRAHAFLVFPCKEPSLPVSPQALTSRSTCTGTLQTSVKFGLFVR